MLLLGLVLLVVVLSLFSVGCVVGHRISLLLEIIVLLLEVLELSDLGLTHRLHDLVSLHHVPRGYVRDSSFEAHLD